MTAGAACRIAAYAATAVVLGAGLTSCGDEPGWDPAAVESYLQKSQAGSFPGLDVGAARCPGHHALADTMTVRCTLAVADVEVPYRVRLGHAREDHVAVDVALDSVVLRSSDIQAYVRSTLPKDFRHAQVDCGHVLVLAQVGDDVDCTLASGAQTSPVSVTVEDEEGRISIT
jgi:hypothetical protein